MQGQAAIRPGFTPPSHLGPLPHSKNKYFHFSQSQSSSCTDHSRHCSTRACPTADAAGYLTANAAAHSAAKVATPSYTTTVAGSINARSNNKPPIINRSYCTTNCTYLPQPRAYSANEPNLSSFIRHCSFTLCPTPQ